MEEKDSRSLEQGAETKADHSHPEPSPAHSRPLTQEETTRRDWIMALVGGLGAASLAACNEESPGSIGDVQTVDEALNTTDALTYADLRSANNPTGNNRSRLVRGRAADSDGGGGLFVWTTFPSSAPNDDDLTVIKPTAQSGNGRWVRLQTLANIATLKKLPPPAGGSPFYQVLGYTNPGDGGGGLFVWNPTSTAADNQGTIIAPNAGGTGRWMRDYAGAVHTTWFGASPTATSNTDAFQKAFDCGSPVIIDPGTYTCNIGLTIAKGANIRGSGWLKSTIHYTGSDYAITYQPPANETSDILLEDFGITTASGSKGGIKLVNANLVTVRRISANGGAVGFTEACIRVSNYNSLNSSQIFIEECDLFDTAGSGDAVQVYYDPLLPGASCGGVYVLKNQIHGCAWGVNGDVGFVGRQGSVHVRDNVIQGCSAGAVTGSFFKGSICHNYMEAGSVLTSGAHIVIGTNQQLFTLIIEDNSIGGTFAGTEFFDIDIQPTGSAKKHLTIRNNHFIRASTAACRVLGVQSVFVGHNWIGSAPVDLVISGCTGVHYANEDGVIAAMQTRPVITSGNSPYTAKFNEELLQVNGSSLQVNLPAANSFGIYGGKRYTVVNLVDTTTTIAASGSDTIKGIGTYALSGQHSSVTLVAITADGVSYQWAVVATT